MDASKDGKWQQPKPALGSIGWRAAFGQQPSSQRPCPSPHLQGLVMKCQTRGMSPQELCEFLRTRAGDAAALNDQAAFNPNITNPQKAKDKASEGNKINPLDVSPANPDISSATEEVEGGIKKAK